MMILGSSMPRDVRDVDKQWREDSGQWAADSGQQTVGSRRQAIANEFCIVECGGINGWDRRPDECEKCPIDYWQLGWKRQSRDKDGQRIAMRWIDGSIAAE